MPLIKRVLFLCILLCSPLCHSAEEPLPTIDPIWLAKIFPGESPETSPLVLAYKKMIRATNRLGKDGLITKEFVRALAEKHKTRPIQMTDLVNLTALTELLNRAVTDQFLKLTPSQKLEAIQRQTALTLDLTLDPALKMKTLTSEVQKLLDATWKVIPGSGEAKQVDQVTVLSQIFSQYQKDVNAAALTGQIGVPAPPLGAAKSATWAQ